METHPIDYVFLYVDPSDEKWQRTFFATCRKYHRTQDCSGHRYRDWGTLPYLFRGIDTCLPWIRNVYMVVERPSQVPDWIHTDFVKIVYHNQIVPSEFLPTYNSNVVELFLHRIPGLSEYFVYGNDDMFPLNPMVPDHFFDGSGNPRLYCSELPYSKTDKMYRHMLKSTERLVDLDLGLPVSENTVLHSDHSINGMKKSTWESLFSKYETSLRKSCSQFRTESNITQELFNFWHYKSGQYGSRIRNNEYMTIGGKTEAFVQSKILSQDIHVLCINDSTVRDFPHAKNFLCSCFQKKFPEKSKYEKI